MPRVWEAWLIENKPNLKRLWAILGALFDLFFIGGIIFLMFQRSCEICYGTQSISGYVKQCTPIIDIYANGHPLASKYVSAIPFNQSVYTEDKWATYNNPDK